MGNVALSWSVGAVSVLVAAVSLVRLVSTDGEARFAAGGELLMGVCMTAMSLPATASWYGAYGMWWSTAFALLGLGGVIQGVKRAREAGWGHFRHWVHLIVGSLGMVIMTLAMTGTPTGPVLALGHDSSMASMPGMTNMTTRTMSGMASMPGMNMAAAGAGTSASSPALWRLVAMALAVYFLLSIAASVWARVRGTSVRDLSKAREAGRRRSPGRWLLAMPDTVVVFLASLTLSVWDKARTAERRSHGRRRRPGASPEAALAAHIGMSGTMSAMLLMMAQ